MFVIIVTIWINHLINYATLMAVGTYHMGPGVGTPYNQPDKKPRCQVGPQI
jgi:hypothetical protein